MNIAIFQQIDRLLYARYIEKKFDGNSRIILEYSSDLPLAVTTVFYHINNLDVKIFFLYFLYHMVD